MQFVLKYSVDITNSIFRMKYFIWFNIKCVTYIRLQQPNINYGTQKKMIWEASQFFFFFHAMEVIGNQNSFVTNSLQNTFFYVQ